MVLRLVRCGSTFGGGLDYGSEGKLWLDKVNALLFVLSPILQHYKGLYRNAGFTLLIAVVAISFIRLLTRAIEHKIDRVCIIAITPLILFQVYKTIDHEISMSKIIYGIFMLFLFLEIASGVINAKYIVKYVSIIGSIAAVCLILQYTSFYIFRKHITMVPVSLLLPESEKWAMGAKTGLYGLRGIRNGFYRPSAFFLEPSHLFLYCFPVLCINLFLPNINEWRKRKAILLSIAMILSTSGMGVLITIALWIAYVVLYNSSSASDSIARVGKLLNVKKLFFISVIAVVICIAYYHVPVFRNSIVRIVGSTNGERSSAIDGRTRLASALVQGLSGRTLLLGVTDNVDDINFNLAGFYATLYKYGIVGVILSYAFYIRGLFRLKNAFFCLTIIILVVSFFSAHTHGTFYMLYYIVLLMNGYHYSHQQNYSEISNCDISSYEKDKWI